MNRADWLDDVRARRVWRFDNELAATYDDDWSAIGETHASYVQQVVGSTPAGGTLLDAACGTGRFFATVLEAGRRVVGTDESRGMLARARMKHPDVQTVCCRLQGLPFADAFEAVLCVDALEYVPPEEWPTVLGNLRRAVKAGRLVYLTVEIADGQEVDAAYREALAQGWPVLPGEVVAEGGRYHFYPRRSVVRQWLADARLEVVAESDADDYWHLLCRA